jgi:hypothetical protein
MLLSLSGSTFTYKKSLAEVKDVIDRTTQYPKELI